MIKKSVYPKTTRVSCSPARVVVTEKLDGSNLCIFKKDGQLYFAQRNNIIAFDELTEVKSSLYTGLNDWITENFDSLNTLNEKSAICCEWIGMGKLKYDGVLDKRVYMFAKANITEDFKLERINYTHEEFLYCFQEQIIPDCIAFVPVVTILEKYYSKAILDELYEEYTTKVNRRVEGFVVNFKNNIEKYVRCKNGKLADHIDRE